MKSNDISSVVRNIHNLPYKCIMFDGPWGIGKTYEVKKIINVNAQACIVSLFGLNDCKELLPKVIVKLLKKNKIIEKIYETTSDIGGFFWEFLSVGQLIKSKLGFDPFKKNYSKNTMIKLIKSLKNKEYTIVFDDLERVGNCFNFEEFLGILEELLQIEGVKVILVSNVEKFDPYIKIPFIKYHEKIVDRIYKVNNISTDIDWRLLKVDDREFTKEYIENFGINNLRTIEKAEHFFQDVKMNVEENQMKLETKFLKIIKKICFSIVVEDIENFAKNSREKDKSSYSTLNSDNDIETIDDDFYLVFIKYYLNELMDGVFYDTVKMLNLYYKNTSGFDVGCINVDINLYHKLGQKINFYKSDRELEEMLIDLEKNLCNSESIPNIIKNIDIIVTWKEVLGVDSTAFLQNAKIEFEKFMCSHHINGNVTIDKEWTIFTLSNQKVKEFMVEIFEIIDKYKIEKYISDINYCKKKKDYHSARSIVKSLQGVDGKLIDESILNELLDENILPLGSINEEHWRFFRELNNLFIQSEGRKKTWEKFIKNSKEKNKTDKAFLNRIRVIEENL